MREIRFDLPRDEGQKIEDFIRSLNPAGWLISFEKGLITSKDHWQGWIDSSATLTDDYQLKKLKDFATTCGLTKGHYAFPIVNHGDKWFSYICKHKSKDVIEIRHSYSSEDLEAKYKAADTWLSKEEHSKELKKVPFLRRCIEVCNNEVLFVHPEGDTYLLRYDLIRKIMYRMFNANEKVFDIFYLQKHMIGIANHYEELYNSSLIQGKKCQRILGGECECTITQLFKIIEDQSVLNFCDWKLFVPSI